MDYDHQLLRRAFLNSFQVRLLDERDKALSACARAKSPVEFRSQLNYLMQVCGAFNRSATRRPSYLRMYDGIGLPAAKGERDYIY